MEKAKRIGIEQYNLEQREKKQILSCLLSGYNDGRKKTFFCVAVNLLGLSEPIELKNRNESLKKVALLKGKGYIRRLSGKRNGKFG